MAANDLVITITARDQATEHLKKIRQEVGDVSTVAGQLERSLGLSSGSLNTFTGALEKVASTIPGLSGSFRALGSVMTASVAGAATGAAAAVLGYGVALNRVADDQARFQRALQSFDSGTIRGEISRVNDELARMSSIGNRIGNEAGTWTGALQGFIAAAQAALIRGKEVFLGAPRPETQREEAVAALGGILGAEQGARQTQIQAGIAGTQQRALLFQQQRRLNAEDLPGALALQQQLEAADKRERDLALRAQAQRQGLELVPLRKEGIPTAALEQTHELERQALAAELEIGLARQKLAREEQAKALRERQIDQRFQPLVTQQEFQQEEAEQGFALTAELQRQDAQRATDQREAADARLRDSKNQAEFERNAAEEQADLEKELDNQRRARADTAVEFSVRQAEIMQQQAGLTRAEYAQAQLITVEAQRQLDLANAKNDAQRELATLTAQVQSENIRRRELERTDPLAGLAAGQREIDESAMAAGDRLRTAYVSAYHDISQGFTDIVVDGLTNQGDKIGDIGKQMGKRLLAGFVDQISQSLFSKVFSSLGSVFGVPSTSAARPLATAVPLLASPFAAPGVAGAATGVGAVAQAGGGGGLVGSGYLQAASGGEAASVATFTPGVATQAASVAGSGIGILGDAVGIGKALLSGFAGPTLSAYGVIAAYSAGGLAGVAAAQALVGAGISESAAALTVAATASEGGAAIGIGGSSALGAGTAPAYGGGAVAGIGATAASVAGGVLAAAALAYTAYSAYQSADIAGGAIGGAISGAALGTAIYPGVGTVVGLIAGAAIGAGAGAAGKEEQEIKGDRIRNEADRQRRGAWIYQDLMNAIQTGIDHEDIAEQTVRTGHSVGGLLMGVAATNQSGAVSGSPWGWPPSENARKAVEILAPLGVTPILDFEWDRINSTMELIASWHNPRGITEGDIEIAKNAEALMAAFVAKQGPTVLVGYEEEGDTGLRGSAGNLTRTTLLRSDRSREAAGRDLFVVAGTLDRLTPEQRQRLLQRLVDQDLNKDLEIRRTESDGERTVSSTYTTEGRPPRLSGATSGSTVGTTSTLAPTTLLPGLTPAQQEQARFLEQFTASGTDSGAATTTSGLTVTDDEAQNLLQQLARVDRNRDLKILSIEAGNGATVTVGT